MAVLATTEGADNNPKSLVGYIKYSTCTYQWLYEIGITDNAQFENIRFGDTDGNTINDGNLIVVITKTYPRKFMVIQTSTGDIKYSMQIGVASDFT